MRPLPLPAQEGPWTGLTVSTVLSADQASQHWRPSSGERCYPVESYSRIRVDDAPQLRTRHSAHPLSKAFLSPAHRTEHCSASKFSSLVRHLGSRCYASHHEASRRSAKVPSRFSDGITRSPTGIRLGSATAPPKRSFSGACQRVSSMSLMGMWRVVVDAFSGSCRRCPRCCWRRELDRASFGLALPVGMLRRWLVRVQRVVMPVTGAESWTVVDGGGLRWSRRSVIWRIWQESSVRRTRCGPTRMVCGFGSSSSGPVAWGGTASGSRTPQSRQQPPLRRPRPAPRPPTPQPHPRSRQRHVSDMKPQLPTTTSPSPPDNSQQPPQTRQTRRLRVPTIRPLPDPGVALRRETHACQD